MSKGRSRIRWAVTGLCAGVLALPAAAGAAAPTGGATAPGGTTTPAPVGATGSLPSAGSLTVAPATVALGEVVAATGSLPTAAAGQSVLLQVQGRAAWRTVARGVAGAGGAFAVTWRARRPGELVLRVVVAAAPGTASTASGETASTPDATLTVDRRVIATWYGPGFYGRHTACGEIMSRSIVGVADRTLPCGTPVSLSYNGQTVVVPVIDRGPYSGAATLDLTHAAAEELGITETVAVGMISLGGPPLAPTNWYPAEPRARPARPGRPARRRPPAARRLPRPEPPPPLHAAGAF